MKAFFFALAVFGCLMFHSSKMEARVDRSTQKMLEELDNYISMRGSYESNKLDKINLLNQLSLTRGTSYEELFSIYSSLADEYYPYNFDSTMNYVHKCINMATQKRDTLRMDESNIKLGYFYVTSGLFLEAYDMLYNVIDFSTLDSTLLVPYYSAMHRMSWELRQLSAVYPQNLSYSPEDVGRYRQKLFELIDPSSNQFLELKVEQMRDDSNFVSADSLNRVLLARIPRDSHSYAKAAYIQSLICESRWDFVSQIQWLIRSAESDIQNSVKDYASLTTISSFLFNNGDLDRAFTYIQISMMDALAYNARLRPWQVFSILPVIENAYQQKQSHQGNIMRIYIFVISILAIVLCGGFIFLINRSKKLNHTQRELQKMNDFFSASNRELEDANKQLYQLNKEISESNTVKEEYIGLFLTILSDNIDKLKNYESMVRKKIKYGRTDELIQEMSRSNMIEEETAAFYQTFDTAFLTLYPNFVEEFNSLLSEEGKIEPKKGEMLNTELRIYALIRLGIDDSSKIAALLRYSVNTIYNYRAKVKNSAVVSRDTFEEIIKTIGEIKY